MEVKVGGAGKRAAKAKKDLEQKSGGAGKTAPKKSGK